MSTLNDVYKWILEGIQDLYQIQEGNVQFEEYLKSLQPYVKSLRQGYKNKRVSVDYTNEKTQFAYLLTYYPQYAEMTRQILDRIDSSLKQSIFSFQKHLNVCLFGAGAAPETIGLVSFIKDNYPDIQSLTIRAFDISSETWKISQNITKNYVLPRFWSGRVVLPTYSLNLCQDNAFISLKNIINSNQVFIFQNCLNELKSSSLILKNINFLIEEMPSNSLLIIADLRIYEDIADIKNNIELFIRNLNNSSQNDFNEPFFILRSPQEGITDFRTSLNLPPIVKNHLLIGKPGEPPTKNGLLTPRTNIKCNFLSVYKLYSKEIDLPKLEIEKEKDLQINHLIHLVEKEQQNLRGKIAQLENSVYQKVSEDITSGSNSQVLNQIYINNTAIEQIQLAYQEIEEKISDLQECYSNLSKIQSEQPSEWNSRLNTVGQTLSQKIEDTLGSAMRDNRRNFSKEIQQLRKTVMIAFMLGGISLLIAILSFFR